MEINFKNIKKFMLIITFTVFLYWGIQNYPTVLSAIKRLLEIFTPFIIGLFVAFIINVLLRMVEEKWDMALKTRNCGLIKRLQRPICLLSSMVIVIGFVLVLLYMVIPEINKTILTIKEMLPGYIKWLEIWWEQISEKLLLYFVELPKFEVDWDKIGTIAMGFVTKGGHSLVDIVTSFFTGIFNLVLGVIFAIYILLQKEKLNRQLKKLLYAFLPDIKVNAILHIVDLSNTIFSKFVKGQLMESFIIGILCFIGMNLFSMPYATMISVLVGFTSLVPVFGAFIGTAVGAFLILMFDPMKALWFIIFIFVLQQLEGDIIYPRVVGKSVGLPGIWVLAAVTIGGSTFGIMGMLLSVPFCSVLYTLLQQNVNNRLKKKSNKSKIE